MEGLSLLLSFLVVLYVVNEGKGISVTKQMLNFFFFFCKIDPAIWQ